MRRVLRDFSLAVIVCVLYFLTGRLGLSLHAVNKYATFIWAPTGIALGALFFLGVRFWPAIFLGAFWVNFQTGAPFFAALGMASGNTCEALISVSLLSRFGFQNFL